MSGDGAEHSTDDPISVPDPDAPTAGDYHADERSRVSEETGTRYDAEGETNATPEDEERRLAEGDEEDAG